MTVPEISARDAVFVDGCRIPFLRSGTGYKDLMAYDLGRMALRALLDRTGIDPAEVDRVILGSVVQNVKTANVARESALGAGFPNRVPAFTISMACISSNQAIASGIDLIRSGQADCIVAGGTESLTDTPIRLKKPLQRRLVAARRFKSTTDYLRLVRGLRPSDLLPEVPEIAEYSTGETMGESADKLAAAFEISREQQDAYALRAHRGALQARLNGLFDDVVPVSVPPDFDPITEDNGVRPDTSLEKLAALPPAFVKPYGTVTAGNSSFLTDGASAVLLMSREAADRMGLEPLARVLAYTFVAQDPGEELLLGPAYAIPEVLQRANLTLDDVDVFELHEAFAGQVLAVLAALRSDDFARRSLGRSSAFGEIPLEKLNPDGGSLSLGHPFGATGARLLTTAVRRLDREQGTYAIVAACAAGGLGHAMLIEREAR